MDPTPGHRLAYISVFPHYPVLCGIDKASSHRPRYQAAEVARLGYAVKYYFQHEAKAKTWQYCVQPSGRQLRDDTIRNPSYSRERRHSRIPYLV